MAHKVTVLVNQVELPNGLTYQSGNVVILTDEQFARVLPSAFTDSKLSDGGYVGTGAVNVQADHVAADAALTAVAVVAANAATQTGAYVQADVQSIATLANANKVQINALVADITALRTTVNTALTNLQVSGGPMASS